MDRNSILGNPYKLYSEDYRGVVINRYKQYFAKQMHTNYEFTKEVNRLIAIYNKYGKLRLFCHCAPKSCHAEIIAEHIRVFS